MYPEDFLLDRAAKHGYQAYLRALVHKYGGVFSWRTEYRLPPFETALRASSGRAGEETGLPFPQGERPTTLAGHPEEARCGRAVSKDLS